MSVRARTRPSSEEAAQRGSGQDLGELSPRLGLLRPLLGLPDVGLRHEPADHDHQQGRKHREEEADAPAPVGAEGGAERWRREAAHERRERDPGRRSGLHHRGVARSHPRREGLADEGLTGGPLPADTEPGDDTEGEQRREAARRCRTGTCRAE